MGLCHGVLDVLPPVQVFRDFHSQVWMMVVVLESGAQHSVGGDDRMFLPGDGED